MGGKDGSNALHKIKNMSFKDDFVAVCKGLAMEKNMMKTTVVVDANNVVYHYLKASSVTGGVANLLVKMAAPGHIIEPVFDGPRPISKQATNQRIAKNEKNRIKALVLRMQRRQIKQSLVTEQMNQDERKEHETTLKKLETQLKTSETRSRSSIPKNFTEELQHELSEMGAHIENDTGGRVTEAVNCSSQADSFMVSKVRNGDALMAATKDSDIPIVLGNGHVTLSSFTNNKWTLVSTDEKALRSAMKYLPNDSNATFEKAKCPVFDGVSDPRLRALMLLIMGCDVYLPGGKNFKLKKMFNFIQTEMQDADEPTLFNALFDKLKDSNN